QPDLEAAELVAAVERALAELPPKRSAVCKLRLIDGLSYAQIADRLGIGEKTVETQLARGLKFLRDQIRPAAAVTHPGLVPGVRTSGPADGSAVNTYRSMSPAAPRGAYKRSRSAALTSGARSARHSATIEPPNPAPVSLAPAAPASRASSTSRSSSGWLSS